MFRTKLTLVLLVVVLAGAFGASTLIGTSADAVEARLVAEVEQTHLTYDRIKRLRDLQMKDVAAALAGSEIAVYLGMLSDHRKEMLAIEAEVYQSIPGPPNDEVLMEERKAWVKEQKKAFLAAFSKELTDRLEKARGPNAWQSKPRAEVMAEVEESLAVCNSFGVNNCVYRFTFFPLEGLVKEMRRDSRYGIHPDKVIIVDHRGTGVADADVSTWSDQTRFGDDHPIAKEVKSGSILRDIVKLGGKAYYFATAAPVFERGKFRGSVVVGVAIDSELTSEEGGLLGRTVGYLEGKEFFRSDLSDQAASAIRHNLHRVQLAPGQTQIKTLTADGIVAQFVPLTGNLTNNGIRAVFVVDKAAAVGGLRGLTTWVWLGAAVLLLLGLLAMARFTHVFMRPFLKIDAGVHEVIDGNREYLFPAGFREPMWASLGNNLNIMVATLTGRDLETEVMGDEWEELERDGADALQPAGTEQPGSAEQA